MERTYIQYKSNKTGNNIYGKLYSCIMYKEEKHSITFSQLWDKYYDNTLRPKQESGRPMCNIVINY